MSIEIATCINLYKSSIEVGPFIDDVNREMDNEWSEIQWVNSAVGDGSIGTYRTSVEANLSNLVYSDSILGEKFKKITDTIINDLMDDYKKQYLISTSSYEGWRALKYSGGGEYHAHYDHSPKNQRTVSVVAFLETPEEGGSLEFPFFGVTVEAIAGDVVIFPSNFPYVHIAHPVTSGTKCSLVTWFQ